MSSINSKHFVKKVKEEWPLIFLTLLLPACFAIGAEWGKNMSDTQNIEYKLQIKKLQDSITVLTRPPAPV